MLVAPLLTACNNNPDIGKVCEKQEDCGEGLNCDVHDGKGTCQNPHGHDGEAESEHEHDSEHEDSSSDVTSGVTTGATSGGTTGTTTGTTSGTTTGATTAAPGEVGDPCDGDSDCAEGLTCDVHDGAGTCQESHDHLR